MKAYSLRSAVTVYCSAKATARVAGMSGWLINHESSRAEVLSRSMFSDEEVVVDMLRDLFVLSNGFERIKSWVHEIDEVKNVCEVFSESKCQIYILTKVQSFIHEV
jgi:hypothetical protein